jgi:hypothetical protein
VIENVSLNNINRLSEEPGQLFTHHAVVTRGNYCNVLIDVYVYQSLNTCHLYTYNTLHS